MFKILSLGATIVAPREIPSTQQETFVRICFVASFSINIETSLL
jgi:hypothetical protein